MDILWQILPSPEITIAVGLIWLTLLAVALFYPQDTCFKICVEYHRSDDSNRY